MFRKITADDDSGLSDDEIADSEDSSDSDSDTDSDDFEEDRRFSSARKAFLRLKRNGGRYILEGILKVG